jgi:sugar phosphate isomerase/epimerase
MTASAASWHGPLCVFPKFLKHLSPPDLAVAVRNAGLDGVAIPVRAGYWCQPESLKTDLPPFIATMRAAGMLTPYAILGQGPHELVEDPTPLALLADQGISMARIGYLSAGKDARRSLADGRDALARLAAHAARLGVRVIVQLHHGTLHASPSGAYLLLENIPPAAVGVKIDPGNQGHEGWEDIRRSIDLLGSHLAAVGVKDVSILRDDAGAWQRPWAPIGQGLCNWKTLVAALATRAFAGPFIFSPFYHENDANLLLETLAQEVSYLRHLLAAHTPTTAKASP